MLEGRTVIEYGGMADSIPKQPGYDGRHLVEHGTEEMVVALVDQRHPNGSAH